MIKNKDPIGKKDRSLSKSKSRKKHLAQEQESSIFINNHPTILL
jgi:hypothetical protein